METYKIEPGKKISIQKATGFYSANSMVTIKGIGHPENWQNSPIRFQITFSNANGNSVGFPILLRAPYYFDAGTVSSDFQISSPGPFFLIEIASAENNPSMVIQVSFTTRLS